MYIWGQPRLPNMNCIVTSFSYDRIAFGTPLDPFGLDCISTVQPSCWVAPARVGATLAGVAPTPANPI